MKFDQPGPRILTLKELEPHLEKLISLETLENQADAFKGNMTNHRIQATNNSKKES